MAPSAKSAFPRIALVTVLAAVLVLLAVLQYRWSVEISRAERTRIETSLNSSVNQFRKEFYRELEQVSIAFRGEPEVSGTNFWTDYAQRYQAWARTAAHPDLVANVYVLHAGESGDSRLLRLQPETNAFAPVDWPASLAPLRGALEGRLTHELPGPSPPPMPELRSFAWTLEQRVPALVHPVFNFGRNFGGPREWLHAPGPPPRRMPRLLLGLAIVELNRAAIDRLLGELAQRYFAGPEGFTYYVEVVRPGPGGRIVYRSDPQLAAFLNRSDVDVPLLPPTAADTRVLEGPPPRAARGRRGPFRALPRGTIILPSPAEAPWQLVARHKGGSLEAVVAAERWRNLLLSFGVLLLLAVSMALIIISAQRARRLARLQIEFVAGVSHELRTPVAVICSAADNLADGLVGAREQVKEYGALIRGQGRRLASMIEQILRFTAGQSRPASYDLGAVAVGEAITQALASVCALPEAEGFTVERGIDPNLPAVQADSAALVRCLENLVLNAFKYGAQGRWARVSASQSEGGARVRVSVEDHGPGIDPAELPHIFQPFYRGKAALAAQIHGAGLGLSLARDIAEGMGGSLEVSSQPGHGSIFTLELPAAAQPAAEPLPRTA